MNRRIAGERRPWRRIIKRARVLGGGRQRWAVVGLASVAGVVGLGLMACDWTATLDATDRANDRLDQTQAELDQTRDDLGTTRETVNANRITLAGAIKTRLAREAERTQVQGSYDATALWLQGLQGQLSNANAALALGATYHPTVLARLGAVGIDADVETARRWYQKAESFGSTEAARRLSILAKQ